jgi:hypothetical protein
MSIGLAPENIHFNDDVKCFRRQYGLRHYVSGTIHSAMGDTYNIMAISVSDFEKQYSLWDRCQLIVILSRTRLMKNTIFVGQKQETIRALKRLLTHRSQWSEYIDKVLDITTIHNESNTGEEVTSNLTLDQTNFPFRICDTSLPQDQTGYVYFLVSRRNRHFVYFGATMCIRSFLINHNSGTGSFEVPIEFRPYALIAYICGFRKDKTLMEMIKETWKNEYKENDVLKWARNAKEFLHHDNDLRCIYLLKE